MVVNTSETTTTATAMMATATTTSMKSRRSSRIGTITGSATKGRQQSPDSGTSTSSNEDKQQPHNQSFKRWLRPSSWSLLQKKPTSIPLEDLPVEEELLRLGKAIEDTSSGATSDTSKDGSGSKGGAKDMIWWLRLSDMAVGEPWRGSSSDYGETFHVQSITLDSVTGTTAPANHEYALKRLPTSTSSKKQKHQLRDKKAMARGLKKLINEATVLARIGNHPNILALRGLPADLGRLELLRSDDFFLLLDRTLGRDNLDKRIRKWRQQSVRNSNTLNGVAGATIASAAIHAASSSPFASPMLLRLESDMTPCPNDEWIPRKTSYAFQIAKAIQACHKAGIILRDLSPHNIGFAQDDPHLVQLYDLGHAQDATDAADSHNTTMMRHSDSISSNDSYCFVDPATLAGRRRYMAGEIWTTGKYSFQSDVYSWAMIYYEMCTETKPYRGLSTFDHQKFVCEGGERPPLAKYCLPEGIDNLLARAWDHKVARRLTIDQVCDRIQTLLLQFDPCLYFYDQGEDDFLFDVQVRRDDDCVSDLDDNDLASHTDVDMDDFDLSTDSTDEVPARAMNMAAALSEDAEDLSQDEQRIFCCSADHSSCRSSKASKPASYATHASLNSQPPESPCKMVPSAA